MELTLRVLDNLGPGERVGLGVAAVTLNAGHDNVALLLGKESGAVGEVDEGEEGKNADLVVSDWTRPYKGGSCELTRTVRMPNQMKSQAQPERPLTPSMKEKP